MSEKRKNLIAITIPLFFISVIGFVWANYFNPLQNNESDISIEDEKIDSSDLAMSAGALKSEFTKIKETFEALKQVVGE